MDNIILKTSNLSKKYGSFTVLDHVSIELYEKHIYGFIGENGAGKTTLMRILTGLSYPSGGTYSLYGKEKRQDIEQMRRYIGSTIEAPALYPEYTAFQNLELQRTLTGNPDKTVCNRLLELMDLYHVRNKKVRKFSMGMKQRLSMALSLAGKPSLLILDEPINGLDPKNIASLRNTLKRLNEEQGITIFISSHILNELYLLATDYIIIHKGRIVEKITQGELEEKCRKYIRVKTNNVPLCLTIFDKELHTNNYTVVDQCTVHLYSYVNEVEKVSGLLMEHHIIVSEISVSEQNLEEYFLSVTGGGCND